MERRHTIQKDLVLNAVMQMHGHVSADEVCEYIRIEHPNIGKGTVFRNLGILAEEGKIRRVEIPDGADRFDSTLKRHYHIRCVKCGKVFDVDMEEIKDLEERVADRHGMIFTDYDILFKGICPECQEKARRNADEPACDVQNQLRPFHFDGAGRRER